MASTPGVKSQGMKFAEELLQRHGWTEGKGLGKRESGISEAIKVKVKCDSAGVGHNSAEQFTFHWWDHVFNKTASSIAVEPDQDGVQVKKVTDEDSAVTNKKPRKALNNPNMLYGRFIKSATLLSGGEKPVENEAESSSDSSEDEDQKLDLSSATKLTDDDLVKICGGRTAHKGARHGLKMSAKLSRIEEQERAFLEKYGKKTSTEEPASGLTLDEEADTARKKEKSRSDVTNEEDSSTGIPRKKKKNKRRNKNDEDALEVDGTNGYEVEDARTSKRNKDLEEILSDVDEDTARGSGQLLETDLKSSKKKKKKKKAADEEAEVPEDHTCSIEDDGRASKKKKKAADGPENHDQSTEDDIRASKKKAVDEDDNGSEDHAQSTEDDIRVSKKKKKAADEVADGPEDHDQSTDHVRSSKKKKKAAYEEVTEQADGPEDHTQSTEDDVRASKKRRKSKVKDYVNEDLLGGQEEDLRLTKMEKEDEKLLNGHDEQAPSEPSKKKKRRKDLEDNLEERPQDEPTEQHVQPAKKKKRQRKAEDIEKQESMEEEQCQSVKNKKSKMKYRDSPTPEEEEQGHDEQSPEHKRKKKRKETHMD